jgi:hypothetical protein
VLSLDLDFSPDIDFGDLFKAKEFFDILRTKKAQKNKNAQKIPKLSAPRYSKMQSVAEFLNELDLFPEIVLPSIAGKGKG